MFKSRYEIARVGEPANFLAAPAPDFYFKRLRVLIVLPSGSGSKEPKKKQLRLLNIGILVKFVKIFISPQTSKVKLQNI